jgi:hypothetical protein
MSMMRATIGPGTEEADTEELHCQVRRISGACGSNGVKLDVNGCSGPMYKMKMKQVYSHNTKL